MPNKQADNKHDISTNNEPEEVQYERGKHPNSQSNLKPYPKGVSGNPLGRKGQFDRIKDILDKYGDEEIYDWNDNNKGTRREQVWETIWTMAIGGNIKYVELLAKLGCLDEQN